MAANTVYNYQMNLNANTAAATRSLKEVTSLLESLEDMSNSITLFPGSSDELKKTMSDIKSLQAALKEGFSYNQKNLDLSKFTASLAKSKTSIQSVVQSLNTMGVSGQNAINGLSNAFSKAQVPIRQTSRMVDSLMINLKKTMQWQISSSLIHGFVGEIQSAIGYVRNLNNALNEIQIVSDLDASGIAAFAKNAQSAAKVLSSSTLDYVNAATIYFQQGDNMAQAMQKASITIKAANASAKSSAEEMSEYMTAIWNSYQVGSHELEKYADVMAALGAKTATSMEEIATSMQKVAATGNAVGVSFSQMSSIIATVSSVTRESAESVGTAYKTILARIGDLKLGGTDEDGIGLGLVSSQLKTMGINILDAQGQLRDMGAVIEEIGSKWQFMSKNQQVALAQAVAGKRQYTQLIALFDNFQSYQTNMNTAAASDGALNKMQDTWAQSWEAASKRVQNATQGIYSNILDDKVFVKFTNVFAEILNGIESVTDGMGGMGSIISLVGGLFVSKLGSRVSETFETIKKNFKIFTGMEAKEMIKNVKAMEEANEQSAKFYQLRASKNAGTKASIEDKHRAEMAGSRAEEMRYKSKLIAAKDGEYVTENQRKTMEDAYSAYVDSVAKARETSAAAAQAEQAAIDSQTASIQQQQNAYDELQAQMQAKKEASEQAKAAEMAEGLDTDEGRAEYTRVLQEQLQQQGYTQEMATNMAAQQTAQRIAMYQKEQQAYTDMIEAQKKAQADLANKDLTKKAEQFAGDTVDKNADGILALGDGNPIREKLRQILNFNDELQTIDLGDPTAVKGMIERFINMLSVSMDTSDAWSDAFTRFQSSFGENIDEITIPPDAAQTMKARLLEFVGSFQQDTEGISQMIGEIISDELGEEAAKELDLSSMDALVASLEKSSALTAEKIKAILQRMGQQMDEVRTDYESSTQGVLNAQGKVLGVTEDTKKKMGEKKQEAKRKNEDKQRSDGQVKETKAKLEEALNPKVGVMDQLTKVVGGLSQIAGAAQMVSGSWKTLSDDSASFVEKLVAATTLLTGLTTIFGGLKSVLLGLTGAQKLAEVFTKNITKEQAKQTAAAAAKAAIQTAGAEGELNAEKQTTKEDVKQAGAAAVKEGIENAGDGAGKGGKLASGSKGLKGAWSTIKTGGKNAFTNIKGGLSGGLGTALGVLAGLAIAITSVVKAVKYYKEAITDHQEAISTLSQDAADASTLINKQRTDQANLVSIIKDTTKSYQEQADALNEIASAYGIVVTAQDVMTGNYKKLYDAMDQEVISQIDKETQSLAVSTQSAIDATNKRIDVEKGADVDNWAFVGAGAGAGLAIGSFFGPLGALIGTAIGAAVGGITSLVTEAVNANDGINSKFFENYSGSNKDQKSYTSVQEQDEWRKFLANNQGLGITIDANGMFDTTELSKKSAEELADIYSTIMADSDLAAFAGEGGFLTELIGEMNRLGVDTISAAQDQMDFNSKLSTLYSSTSFDQFSTSTQGFSDIMQIFNEMSALGQGLNFNGMQEMLQYMQGFEGYSESATKMLSMGNVAKDVAARNSEADADEVQKAVWDKLMSMVASGELTLDEAIYLDASDVQVDVTEEGLEVTVSEGAIASAKDQAANQLKIKVRAQVEVIYDTATQETIDYEDYQTLAESDYWKNKTPAELKAFAALSAEERKAYLDRETRFTQDDLDASQRTLETKRAEATEKESTYLDKRNAWFDSLDTSTMGAWEDVYGDLDMDTYKGMSEDEREDYAYRHVTEQVEANRRRIDTYTSQDALSSKTVAGKTGDDVWGLTWEQINSSKNDTKDTDLSTLEAFSITSQADWEAAVALHNQGIEEAMAYNSQYAQGLQEVALLEDDFLQAQTEMAIAQKDYDALDYWINYGQAISDAKKNAEGFAAAIGQSGSMSAEALKELAYFDENVLTNYKNMSSDQWNEYAFQKSMEYYDQLAGFYEGDLAKQMEIQQQKEAVMAEYYDGLKEQNTAALEQMNKEYEELVANIEDAIGLLDNIQGEGLSSLGLEGLEELRQALMEVYDDAELVDNMIKNIGKTEAGSKEEALALADAKMMLQMKEHSVNAERLQMINEMASVSLRTDTDTSVELPYVLNDAGTGYTVQTERANVPVGTEVVPDDIFLQPNGSLTPIGDAPPGVYEVYSNSDGINTTVLGIGNDGPHLYDLGEPEIGTYSIQDEDDCDILSINGKTVRLPKGTGGKLQENGYYIVSDIDGTQYAVSINNGVATLATLTENNQEGYYKIIEQPNGDFTYVYNENGTVKQKTLTKADNTDGGYNIQYSETGDGFTYMDENGKQVPLVTTTDNEGKYIIAAEPNGAWTALIDPETKKVVAISQGNAGIEVTATPGSGATWKAGQIAPDVNLDTLYQDVVIRYLDTERDINNTLYEYGQLKDTTKIAGTNALGGTNDERGTEIQELTDTAAILEFAETQFNGDYVDAISTPVGWDMHVAAMDELGTEAVASMAVSTSNLEDATWLRLFGNGSAEDGNSYSAQEYFKILDGIVRDYYASGAEVSIYEFLSEQISNGIVPEWIQTWTPDIGWDSFNEGLEGFGDSSIFTYDDVDSTNALLNERVSGIRTANILETGEVTGPSAQVYDFETGEYRGIMDQMIFESDQNGWREEGQREIFEMLYNNPDMDPNNLNQVVIDYFASQEANAWDLFGSMYSATVMSGMNDNLTEDEQMERLAEVMELPTLDELGVNNPLTGKAFTAVDKNAYGMYGWVNSLNADEIVRNAEGISQGFDLLFNTISQSENIVGELETNSDLISESIIDFLLPMANTPELDIYGQKIGQDLTDTFITGIAQGHSAEDMVNALFGSEEEFLAAFNVNDETRQIGAFIIDGLVAGIQAAVASGEMDAAAGQVAIDLLSSLRSSLGIASPSKATMEMGRWLVKGLEKGLNETPIEISGFANAVMTSITKALGQIDINQLWADKVAEWDMEAIGELTDVQKATLASTYATNKGLENTEDNPFTFEDMTPEMLAEVINDPSTYAHTVTGKYATKADYLSSQGYSIQEVPASTEGGATTFAIYYNGEPLYEAANNLMDFASEDAAMDTAVAMAYAQEEVVKYYDGGYNADKNFSQQQRGIMTQIIDEAKTALGTTSLNDFLKNGGTLEEWYAAIDTAFKAHQTSFQNAVDMDWAKMKQSWMDSLADCQEIDDQAAQETYERWKTVWEAVAALRVAAINGEEGTVSDYLNEEQRNEIIARQYHQGKSRSDIAALLFGDVTEAKDDGLLTLPSYIDSGRMNSSAYMGLTTNGYGFANTPTDWTAYKDQYVTDLTETLTYINEKRGTLGTAAEYGRAAELSRDENGRWLSDNEYLAAYYNVEDATTLSDEQRTMALQERMVADSMFTSGMLVKDDNDKWQVKGSDGKFTELTPEAMAALITEDWDQDKWQTMMDESLLQAWQNEFEYLADYHKQFSDEMDATIKRKQQDQDLLDKYESGEAMTKDEQARVDSLVAQYGNVDAASMALAADMDQCAGSATRLAEAMSLGLVPVVGTLVAELSKVKSESTEIVGATTEAEATQTAQATVGSDVTLGEYQLMGNEYVRYSVTENDGKYYLRKDVVAAEDVIDVSDENATYTNPTTGKTYEFSDNDHYYQDQEYAERASDAGFSGLGELDEQANYLARLNGEIKEGTELSGEMLDRYRDISIMAKKAAKGWDGLTSSGKDYVKTMRDSTKSSDDYMKAARGLKKDLKNIFGDSEQITEEFVAAHLDDIEKMADGDVEAAERIEKALLEDMLGDNDLQVNIDVNEDGVVNQLDNLSTLLNGFGDQYADKEIGFTITADDEPAINALNALLQSGAMTADQMNQLLATIGWKPEITYQTADGKSSYSGEQIQTMIGDGTATQVKGTSHFEIGGQIYFPVIGSVQKTGGGASSIPTGKKNGGGGGGGGGKPTATKKKDKDKERYHEVTKLLDKQANILDRIGKEKERAYGKSYVDQLNKETAALKQNIEYQKRYLKEIEKNKSKDKREANKLLGQFGLSLQDPDGDGVVDNWEEIQDAMWDAYNSHINNDGEVIDMDEDEWADYEEAWQDAMDALNQYEETMALSQEQQNELEEMMNNLSDLNAEKITYVVETKLELNDADIELLEYFQDKYEDGLEDQDQYFSALMANAQKEMDSIRDIRQAMTDLDAAYRMTEGLTGEALHAAIEAGGITLATWQEEMTNLNSDLIDKLSTLQDLKEQMAEMYGQTLELALDRLEEQIGYLDSVAEAMTSFRDLSMRLGDGATSGALRNLEAFFEIEKQANEAAMQGRIDYYKTVQSELAEWLEQNGTNPDNWTDTQKQQYADLMESVTDAHSAMIDAITAQLDTLQEEFENSIDTMAKTFEERVSAINSNGESMFTSFAQFQEAYSYFQEQQDQYLSTAQEMLNINKLNRNIEQSMEDAVTKTGKARLEALQKEIKARSEAGKLSQYDLDMMNLQYELVLKKNALEEAQNAKDTVRLTRDEHGNMAYQYTANEDNVAKAEQEYEDVLAQINDLSTNRQSELLSQFADAEAQYAQQLAEIAKDTSLSYEERQARMEQLAAQYKDRLLYLQEQYSQATSDLTNNEAAIGSIFGTSVNDANAFADAVDAMFSEEAIQSHIEAAENMANGMISAMGDYETQLTNLNNQLDGLIPTEEEMTQWSDFISGVGDQIEGVNDDLATELDQLQDINEEWLKMEETINRLVPEYEALAQAVNDMVRDAAELEESGAVNVDMDTTVLSQNIQDQTDLQRTHYEYVERVLEMIANDEDTQRALVGTPAAVTDEVADQVFQPHPNALNMEDHFLQSIANNVEFIARILSDKYGYAELEVMAYQEDLMEQQQLMQAEYMEAIHDVMYDPSLGEDERIKRVQELGDRYGEYLAVAQGAFDMSAAVQNDMFEVFAPINTLPTMQTMANQWLSEISSQVGYMLTDMGSLAAMIKPMTELRDQKFEQAITIAEANFPGVVDFQALVEAIAELGLASAQTADSRGGGGGSRR